MEAAYKGVRVVVVKGDLTRQKTEAVVNPANSAGVMGGGVALALKEAGGEQMEKDAMRLAPLKVGRAVATGAGNLACRYVIHAPTMALPGEKANAKAVDQAVTASLRLAKQMSLKSVAFPLMGAGTGRVPAGEAASAMANSVKFFLDQEAGAGALKEIFFVAFDDDAEKALAANLQHLKKA